MTSRISDLEHQSDQSSQESQRKKRRKLDTSLTNEFPNTASSSSSSAPANHHIKWRSPVAQQTYSSKLAQALQQVRRNSSSSASVPPPVARSRAIRDTADRILAIAARGRTRWSRAILKNRLKLRLKNHKKAKSAKSRLTVAVSSRKRSAEEASATQPTTVPPLLRRVQVLGRLVPGCRKLSFPNLLEEATDYIAALEMQVRAMAELAEFLTGAQTGTSGRREGS